MRFYHLIFALIFACSTETGNPEVTETGNPKVTETGNPQVTARLAVTALTTDAELVSFESDIGELIVDSAWVVFGDLRFVRDDQCEDPAEAEVTVEGPLVVDLIDFESTIDAFKMGAGDYCRIRLPMDRGAQLPPDAPIALDDAAVVIDARRADGTAVYVTSRTTEDVELKSEDEPLVIDQNNRHLVVGFDLAKWFDEMDFDDADVEPNGDILIDEDHNDDLLDQFEDNIEDAMKLFEDSDEDGELDDDEDDDPLAER
jgi:hypothetical protein